MSKPTESLAKEVQAMSIQSESVTVVDSEDTPMSKNAIKKLQKAAEKEHRKAEIQQKLVS